MSVNAKCEVAVKKLFGGNKVQQTVRTFFSLREQKIFFSTQLRKTRPKGLVFSQTVSKNPILTSKLDYPSLVAKFSHSFHS